MRCSYPKLLSNFTRKSVCAYLYYSKTARHSRSHNRLFSNLAFASQYLNPVAEAIAIRMQAAVSINIIGPIPEKNGEVEVRRCASSR
jgi:hypothetical protein